MKKGIFFALLLSICISGCAKEKTSVSDYVKTDSKPETNVSKETFGIDFLEMHNSIIELLSNEYTPFFFIKDNCFDISGENGDHKKIVITVDCIDGTIKHDLDLFLSRVLIEVGINASEQDYNYVAPSADSEGTYLDYGTVFNDYDLVIKATVEGNNPIYDVTIKKGNSIPIDPKYWSE